MASAALREGQISPRAGMADVANRARPIVAATTSAQPSLRAPNRNRSISVDDFMDDAHAQRSGAVDATMGGSRRDGNSSSDSDDDENEDVSKRRSIHKRKRNDVAPRKNVRTSSALSLESLQNDSDSLEAVVRRQRTVPEANVHTSVVADAQQNVSERPEKRIRRDCGPNQLGATVASVGEVEVIAEGRAPSANADKGAAQSMALDTGVRPANRGLVANATVGAAVGQSCGTGMPTNSTGKRCPPCEGKTNSGQIVQQSAQHVATNGTEPIANQLRPETDAAKAARLYKELLGKSLVNIAAVLDTDASGWDRFIFFSYRVQRFHFPTNSFLSAFSPFSAVASDMEGVTTTNVCAVCGAGGILHTCKRCPLAFHAGCVDPLRKRLNRPHWFCDACFSVKGSDTTEVWSPSAPPPVLPPPSTGLERLTADAKSGNPIDFVFNPTLYKYYKSACGRDWLRCHKCNQIKVTGEGVLAESVHVPFECSYAFWRPESERRCPPTPKPGMPRVISPEVAAIERYVRQRSRRRNALFYNHFGEENRSDYGYPSVEDVIVIDDDSAPELGDSYHATDENSTAVDSFVRTEKRVVGTRSQAVAQNSRSRKEVAHDPVGMAPNRRAQQQQIDLPYLPPARSSGNATGTIREGRRVQNTKNMSVSPGGIPHKRTNSNMNQSYTQGGKVPLGTNVANAPTASRSNLYHSKTQPSVSNAHAAGMARPPAETARAQATRRAPSTPANQAGQIPRKAPCMSQPLRVMPTNQRVTAPTLARSNTQALPSDNQVSHAPSANQAIYPKQVYALPVKQRTQATARSQPAPVLATSQPIQTVHVDQQARDSVNYSGHIRPRTETTPARIPTISELVRHPPMNQSPPTSVLPHGVQPDGFNDVRPVSSANGPYTIEHGRDVHQHGLASVAHAGRHDPPPQANAIPIQSAATIAPHYDASIHTGKEEEVPELCEPSRKKRRESAPGGLEDSLRPVEVKYEDRQPELLEYIASLELDVDIEDCLTDLALANNKSLNQLYMAFRRDEARFRRHASRLAVRTMKTTEPELMPSVGARAPSGLNTNSSLPPNDNRVTLDARNFGRVAEGDVNQLRPIDEGRSLHALEFSARIKNQRIEHMKEMTELDNKHMKEMALSPLDKIAEVNKQQTSVRMALAAQHEAKTREIMRTYEKYGLQP